MRALERLGQALPLGELQGLASLGQRRSFESGQVLLIQGSGASYAALITRGLVKVTASSAGHETFLAIRGPGDLLGEDIALRGPQASRGDGGRVEATALTGAAAVLLHASALLSFLHERPAAAFAVTKSLSERLAEAESRICSAARDGADRRLARLLCDLERYGDPAGDGSEGATRLPFQLSHAELASWIGASRETVDRALRRWRQRGIISTEYRDVVIRDRQALNRIAGIPVSPRRALLPAPANGTAGHVPGPRGAAPPAA